MSIMLLWEYCELFIPMFLIYVAFPIPWIWWVPNFLLQFFIQYTLFSHSHKTKALWKEQTSKAMTSLSKTRWWSRWEIYNQIWLQFGDIEPFLTRNQDLGPTLRPKLLQMITDVNTLPYLQMELAAVVDVGEHFVKATYNLEGDGALVLRCYEEIIKIRAALQVAHYPNMSATSCSNKYYHTAAVDGIWN